MTFPGGRKRLSFSYLDFHKCSAIIKKFKCHLYTDTNTVCSFFKMPSAFVLFESSTGMAEATSDNANYYKGR